jgi:drug/metabolite transporter (DMT)-like permease
MAQAGQAQVAQTAQASQAQTALLRKRQLSAFFSKGVLIAVFSGILYGVYSAFLLAATGSGEWALWYEGYDTGAFTQLPFSFMMGCLILGALGSGINDVISALWMDGKAAVKGKFGDFMRCLFSKPGAVMAVCAVIGGPIASTAYLIALTMAGPIATPISALCPAVGAVIGRLLFKQKLNLRMVAGILICIVATFMIGSSAFGGITVDTQFLIGLAIAFVAALGWGIEGAIAGYGTALIDYEIGISIRQTVSGVVTLFVLTPLLFVIAGQAGFYPEMLGAAFTGPIFVDGVFTGNPIIFFLISGLAAGLSFGFWYKGNSMCGAALGMACNGGFSFWVPFFSFLVCGVFLGWGDAYYLSAIQWAAAIVMVVGIFLIAVNPLDWFRQGKGSKERKEA